MSSTVDMFDMSASTGQTQNAEGGEGEKPEDYVPEDVFVPVIPLPEVVDVVTGEEGEEVVFEERADRSN